MRSFRWALGIGANTAVFSIIDTLLLKRLPVKSPQELYRVVAGKDRSSWNYPDYIAFRDQNRSIALAACGGGATRVGMKPADADASAPAVPRGSIPWLPCATNNPSNPSRLLKSRA